MVREDRPLPGQTESIDGVHIRTFLIADVRGYTLFTQERGDEVAAKLAAKFAEIAREIVQARGGTLLELRGDEALCVFSSTREAIRAAVDLQQRFVEETLEQPELPLTVGIGLDAGEAVPVEGGYRGAALNLAARLCGQARAGEILATREVTHLARRIEGARYEDRGSLSFKGISDPVVVVRVVPEGVDPVERLRPYAPPPPPPPKTSRRWVVVGAIAAVLALVAISIPLLSSGDDDAVDIGTNSVARMNAEDGSLELATELGQRPGASAIGFGSLWVAQPDRGRVARLDLEDGSIVDTITGRHLAGRRRRRRGLGVGHERRRRHGEPDRPRDERGEPDDPSTSAPGHRASRSVTARCGSPTRSEPSSCGWTRHRARPRPLGSPASPRGVAFTPNGRVGLVRSGRDRPRRPR